MASFISASVLVGFKTGIGLSLAALGKQMATPAVFEVARIPGSRQYRRRSDEHPGGETFPGLLIVRIVDRIFFANVHPISARLQEPEERTDPKVVIVDMQAVPDLEYTALKMLLAKVGRLKERGITLRLVGLTPAVKGVVRRPPWPKPSVPRGWSAGWTRP